MKYTFVKLRMKSNGELYPDWYLICDNIEKLDMYFNEIRVPLIPDAVEHINKNKSKLRHFQNVLANNAQFLNLISEYFIINNKGCDIPMESLPLFIEVDRLKNQKDILQKGKILLLTSGLPYMVSNKEINNDIFEIAIRIDASEILFPIFNKDDVRITQWNEQGHYYAKIGKLDVNLDGYSKWNSKIECENAIEKYIDKFELKII